jgi:hypothetical protein
LEGELGEELQVKGTLNEEPDATLEELGTGHLGETLQEMPGKESDEAIGEMMLEDSD